MKFVALIALLVFWFVDPVLGQGRYPVAVGETHPDFLLFDVTTLEPVSLSGYRGKKVLLIHFASW